MTRIPRAALAAALLAPLLFVVGTLTTSGSASAAGCSLATTNGTVTRTLWINGQGFRSYNLRVPARLTGNVPLLISHHGLGSNAFFQETASGWSAYADTKKFIVAYPAGSSWGQSWDLGQGSPDSAFVRKVAQSISSTYCVDSSRVYAEGGSLGGYMTQRVLCDHEDLFASGISTISGPLDATPCSLSRGVSIGIVNVEGDPLFPTANSITTRDQWLDRDNCSTTGTTETNAYGANAAVYGGCDNGAEVLWRTYTGTQHAYPTGAALADFHDRTWAFLQAHPKP